MENKPETPANAESVGQTTSEAPLAAPTGSAKRRSAQCQCCASPLGEPIRVENTERVICPTCLGFIARWWIELGNLDRTVGTTDTSQNVPGEPLPPGQKT